MWYGDQFIYVTTQELIMHVKVFTKESQEQTIRLMLYDVSDGVMLCVVGECGEYLAGGDILKIANSGVIKLCHSISPDMGFELTSLGMVKVT